jgi:hypothetical protein
MKVIIDIPKDHKRVIDNLVEDCKGYLLPYEVENRMAVAIRNGKVLDDMTNKEIMCSLYPDQIYGVSELKHKDSNLCDVTFEVRRTAKDWWDSKYKGEE